MTKEHDGFNAGYAEGYEDGKKDGKMDASQFLLALKRNLQETGMRKAEFIQAIDTWMVGK